MKLATKIVLLFLLGSVLLLALDGLLAVRRERRLFEEDAEADARLLGRAMRTAVSQVWSNEGRDLALRLIAEIDRERPDYTLRWLWIDRQPGGTGELMTVAPDLAARLRAGEEVALLERKGVQSQLVSYYPVRLESGALGAIELAESLAPVDKATRSGIIRIGLLTLGIILLAVGLAVPVGIRLVGRPLQRLVEKTRRVGRDDFSDPLQLPGKDELSELADAVNAMCAQLASSREGLERETEARIAALEQLRHEDRLRTVGRLASGLAHELGTPLNVVQGRGAMLADRKLSDEQVIEAGRIITAQAKSMTAIVRQLLDFARRPAPRKTWVRPAEIARQVTDLLRPLAQKRGASVRIEMEEEVGPIPADPGQIQQVLTNLVVNGLQAVGDSGRVDLVIGRRSLHPPKAPTGDRLGFVCFTVRDDGGGIADEDLPHLFEPFFTTKKASEGTGLGLAIAEGIVREHGGWIEVESRLGQGSEFSVFLPLEERS